MTSAWALSELRRELQRFMRLDRVVEIKAQLDFVIAQLSYGDPTKKPKGRWGDAETREGKTRRHGDGETRRHGHGDGRHGTRGNGDAGTKDEGLITRD